MRCRAEGDDIGGEFPLKHGPRERRLAIRLLDTDDIRDERPVEARGEFRCEVPRLVGMWQENQRRRQLSYGLLDRRCISVRGVGLERGVVERRDAFHLRRGEFGSRAADLRPEYPDGDGLAVGDLLRRCHGFPGRPIELPAALFSDNENHVIGPLLK